jgi:uncharacterized membrane protein YjfL (UPF0719 family)
MAYHTRYVALFAAATLVLLLVALRVLRPLFARGTPSEGAAPARRMVEVGEVLGTLLIGAAVVKNNVRAVSLRADLAWTAAFAAAGFLMVQLVAWLSLRALLRARLPAELARGNVAAGVAAASHVLATSVLASRAVAGHSARELGLALVFFALALLTHGVLVALFRALTTYDDAEQIQGENLAAALSYAGVTVSVAVLVARAVEGDFTGWTSSLRGFAGVAAWALVLYPVRQLVVAGLLLGARPTLRGGALDQAVGTKRDAGVAALEAATYLGTALAVAVVA